MGTSHSIGRSSLSPQNLKDANPHFESALHPTRSSPHKKRTMAETKKESFRKYLESAGVIDSLTKVLSLRGARQAPKRHQQHRAAPGGAFSGGIQRSARREG